LAHSPRDRQDAARCLRAQPGWSSLMQPKCRKCKNQKAHLLILRPGGRPWQAERDGGGPNGEHIVTLLYAGWQQRAIEVECREGGRLDLAGYGIGTHGIARAALSRLGQPVATRTAATSPAPQRFPVATTKKYSRGRDTSTRTFGLPHFHKLNLPFQNPTELLARARLHINDAASCRPGVSAHWLLPLDGGRPCSARRRLLL
jgi:hypothetical protein